ncbi:hypothetical protein D5S17_02335 [Pseudonocardiaceae bacterium YIM PH 21723]|nr:hypothetical protein D5S17_02335 [Pseudonocardiaceae bacterium YIM PH 21723]
MRFAGHESWLVSVGEDPSVDTALCLRDALALPVHTEPDLPALAPPIQPVDPAGLDLDAIVKEWPGWWSEVLRFAGRKYEFGSSRARLELMPIFRTSPSLTRCPNIREALAHANQAIMDWQHEIAMQNDAVRAPIDRLVQQAEQRAGRSATNFELVLTVVRVAGPVWQRLDRQHVLVSEQLINDRLVYQDRLAPLVDELV